jgi:hypothetical protein
MNRSSLFFWNRLFEIEIAMADVTQKLRAMQLQHQEHEECSASHSCGKHCVTAGEAYGKNMLLHAHGPSMIDNEDDDDDSNDDYEFTYEDDDGYNSDHFDIQTSSMVASVLPSAEETIEVLSDDELIEKQSAFIGKMSTLFNIDLTTAGVLCRHFNWNEEKLTTAFFEDSDRAMAAAKINPENVGTAASSVSSSSPSSSSSSSSPTTLTGLPTESVECGVCFMEYGGDEVVHAFCGHYFCMECYRGYIEASSANEMTGLKCMEPKCGRVLPDAVFRKVLDDERYGRYKALCLQDFCDKNPDARFCIRAGCGKVLYSKSPRGVNVVGYCSCGQDICMGCSGEGDHRPVSCAMWRTYKQIMANESLNWLVENTRVCPSCKSTIFRDGGCNHMTCTRCRFEFCWLCEGAWAGHQNCPGKRVNMDQNRESLLKVLNLLRSHKKDVASMQTQWTRTNEIVQAILTTSESIKTDEPVVVVEEEWSESVSDFSSKRRRVDMQQPVIIWLRGISKMEREDHGKLLRSNLDLAKPFVPYIANTSVVVAFLGMDNHNNEVEMPRMWLADMITNMNDAMRLLSEGLRTEKTLLELRAALVRLQQYKRNFDEL